MVASQPSGSISRRAALTGFGAGSFGIAFATSAGPALAQGNIIPDLSGHPNVGVWMIDSPIGRAIAVYSADGSVITALAASQAGPQGVAFSSTQIGTWEATGERTTHLTVVQLLSDGAGAFSGSVTVDAYQTVSEDGQRFTSEEGTSVTIRDATNAVVDVIANGPPAVGTRMGVGAPGFPDGSAPAATPTS